MSLCYMPSVFNILRKDDQACDHKEAICLRMLPIRRYDTEEGRENHQDTARG
jgi:hypothetical protein